MTVGQRFAQAVVRWQQEHGRRELPWQNTRDPYRVWLSEIMLQQTQVATVLGYYDRFLLRFPSVAALAAAPEDAVLAEWSGLGYYSRARNLHRAARKVVAEHGGVFPRSAAELAQLPGIGRSTAAAIAAFCFGEQVPILDANVRRVLSRFLAFEHDLARAPHERALWALATDLVPQSASDMPAYTQGLMDLGASVCTARKPSCASCPLASACAAWHTGEPERFPVRSRKLLRKSESWWLLFLREPGGRIWLQRRPEPGIWAGLFCAPVFPDQEALLAHAGCKGAGQMQEWAPVRHALTHRQLLLHPVEMALSAAQAMEENGAWFAPGEWPDLGLPAPVRSMLAACR